MIYDIVNNKKKIINSIIILDINGIIQIIASEIDGKNILVNAN